MADVFSRIASSRPSNATAARVTARGQHWKPETPLPPGLMHWDAPPQLKRPDPERITEGDLTGTKFGRFTVVGLLNEAGGKNRGNRWVCRCVCGDYEARSARAIKVASLYPADTLSNQCFYCQHWAVTKIRYNKKGSKPLSAFINSKPKVSEPDRPETIIADKIAQMLELPDEAYKAAIDIIATLNKKGFRIVRAKKSGILVDGPATSDGERQSWDI